MGVLENASDPVETVLKCFPNAALFTPLSATFIDQNWDIPGGPMHRRWDFPDPLNSAFRR